MKQARRRADGRFGPLRRKKPVYKRTGDGSRSADRTMGAIIVAIRDVRLDANLTQEQAGERAGMNPKIISHREGGFRTEFRVVELVALLEAYGEDLLDFCLRVKRLRREIYGD